MPPVLSARDLDKSYGSTTLFTGLSIQLLDDDRMGLIGPNGAGKSTLLKILAGLETADEGEITARRGLRQVYIAQDDQFAPGATPRSAVVERLEETANGQRLDAETQAAITLSKLGFEDHEQPVDTLSGGWRKRLSIACALACEPDILMLDEPTNHLDLEGVLWLEAFVQQTRMAVVFITHDRQFLENAAHRIIELSPAYPDGSFEIAGNYSEFVRRKSAFLEAQATAQAALANKVRQDTSWLLQGIQGRQTRNKAQIVASDDRRAELKALGDRNAAPKRTTTIDFQATERKTKKLLAAHALSKSMGDRRLFEKLDLTLSPGRRVGLVGVNGSGKTTLLRLVSGELEPDSGTIKRADALRVVTFAQHRGDLVPTQTLQEALCPVGDTVDYRGQPVHVTGWAKRFLFAADQLATPVGTLSGGEQARVLIAKLMLEPADILLLDEPTNDLDIPSLEVLEQALLEFPGAILLVTHDRFMLERISTEFLALDGEGGAKGHATFDQWQDAVTHRAREAKARPARTEAPARPRPDTPKPRKITYQERLDLEGMEETILAAETEVERLETMTADPAVIADHVRYAEACRKLGEAQQKVRALYERWAELDALQT